MFSSIFSTSPPVDPTAPTFHPVSSQQGKEAFGQLEAKDTEWLCPGGFSTETQVFYTIGDDGTFLICQIIHSAVGVWYPTIQFTCKVYDPKSKDKTWRRSSKADEFSVTHKSAPDSEYPESYTIRANLSTDLQISLEVSRPKLIPGFKIGQGEKGGYSYFGPDPLKPEAISIQGPGMFIHAIQGMRPNLVASSWNFANFQSPQQGGVSAIQMEFKTLENYGRKGSTSGGVVVSIGSLVVGDKLAAVTAETHWPDEESSPDAAIKSRAVHLKPYSDTETGYQAPSELAFEWAAPSLLAESPGAYAAKVQVDVGDNEHPKGLVEKVDVLAEIPRVIKLAVNYVAGTKPYIYQWLNPATLTLIGPEAGQSAEIEGTLYAEATFIS
ncbi:oxidative stress survival Svf1-like protein [Mycena rosella]|uniref:Oxidative stress survival Svf1-like protein n=1 Tax=Mycena rosella TaxID=1033263 RepID=A0AAD7MAE2_MYCRO|nr:oxidative stress survival Svf1-like protein [Mycena rosella]